MINTYILLLILLIERVIFFPQVIERDFVPSIHGEMEFAVHFGRIYVLSIPKSFTEDTECPTVRVFQTNLSRGYKPRPSVLSTTRSNRKYGRKNLNTAKSRNYKKRKGNELREDGKKTPKEKSSRSSFFTIVSSQEKIASFLTQRGFNEILSSEIYSVEIHTDHEFCVIMSKDFSFHEIAYPKLRWCAVDVKRAWRENPEHHDVTDLDGIETDVRFVLQTRHALRPDDIRGTSYEQYRDTLQPQSHPKPSRCPFVVKPDVWKDVAMIRHKKSRMYKLDEVMAMGSEFRKSLCISVNEVTEYSRPTKHASAFSKVFTRWEVTVKPGLPNSWGNSEAVEKLLRDIWAFAFALACHMSD